MIQGCVHLRRYCYPNWSTRLRRIWKLDRPYVGWRATTGSSCPRPKRGQVGDYLVRRARRLRCRARPAGTLEPLLPEADEADWPALARCGARALCNPCLINEAFVQFAQQPATLVGA